MSERERPPGVGRPGVLITGAGGFLGKNLSRNLAERGYELQLISRRDDPELRALPRTRLWTGSAAKLLEEEIDLSGITAVVHLASATNPRRGEYRDEVRQLEELVRMLEALRAYPETAFVFPSSGGTVYRELPYHRAHREEDPVDARGPYSWGKLAAERLIEGHGREHGLRYKLLRAANVYGPEQSVTKRQGLVMKVLDDVARHQPTEIWGDGLEERDYFYVDDFSDLVERMLRRPELSGTYNCGSGVGLSVNRVIEIIASAIDIRPQVKHSEATAGAVRYSVLDSSRAAHDFGWRATTPLPVGVRQTWEWLRSQR